MADPLSLHPAADLLSALCTTINKSVYPKSKEAMKNGGTQLFGAAILLKKDLSLVLADTNQESDSPIWHGETYTVTQFYAIPKAQRPNPKDCIFLSTHEPCSLCINAITWGGFDNFIYCWTYEETDELFGIDGDLKIFADCFYDDGKRSTEGGPHQASLDGKVAQRRPEYKLNNGYFVARSFAELLAALPGSVEDKKEWADKVQSTKDHYGALSPTYRKRTGVQE